MIGCRLALVISGGGGGFTPMSSFVGGIAGALYDHSYLPSLFLDRSMTPSIPATIDGLVGTRLDLSGNGNHSVAPSDAARGTLRTDGTLYWIEYGGDDSYAVPSVNIAQNMSEVFAFSRPSSGINSIGFGAGAVALPHGHWWYIDNQTYVALGATESASLNSSSATGQFVTSNIRNATNEILRRNGLQRGTRAAAAVSGTITHAGKTGGSFSSAGTKVYAQMIIAKELTDNELTQIENWFGVKAGLDIPFLSKYERLVVVNPDGTGDYTTLKAAVETVGAGSADNQRVLYHVHEGVYTDTDYFLPHYSDIIGIGALSNIWLKGELPENASLTDISLTSTVGMNRTTKLVNLRITCKNMRYPIHSDSSASANLALQEIEDCDIEHFGNDAARIWQAANGGDANGVWKEEQAFGCGTHSGEQIYSRRTRWAGHKNPFGFHTNKDFALPNYIELDNCQIVNTVGGLVGGVSNLGTGGTNHFVIRDCVIDGILVSDAVPWFSEVLANQRGKRTSETEITISGSSPVAWTSTDSGVVLELRSIDAVASAVVVSGTGATALFGASPVIVAGGSGYPARIYSYHAIIGMAGTSLGERLGNCTIVNKTLNIVFDGSINITLTLDQNYSAMNNVAVVSALNILLADGSRSFYVATPYNETAPIFQTDRETLVTNISAVVILKGMAVASAGRKATSADARPQIAGVALENIVPSATGRVLASGNIHKNAVLFNGVISVAIGDVFGVSSTAGEIVESASVSLLRYIATDAFEFV